MALSQTNTKGFDGFEKGNTDVAVGAEIVEGVNDAGTIPKGQIDPVYEAKARVLNRAIQDIGMGW